MIRYVTTNAGKAHNLAETLRPHGVRIVHVELKLNEPQTHDIDRIAIAKAHEAYARVAEPVLVQDSGFELDAWPGFPGAYAKAINETIGNEGVLALLAGRTRGCGFRQVWAYHDGAKVHTYEEIERGRIAEAERGELDGASLSPLWRIYVPDGSDRTLAEFDEEDFVEHRKRHGKRGLVGWLLSVSGPNG